MSAPRWAEGLGCALRTAAEHAQGVIESVAAETRRTRASAKPAAHVEPALLAAYEAGVREGESRTLARLGSIMRERVARAVASIVVDPAPCPHCAARGCDECGDSGKRRER